MSEIESRFSEQTEIKGKKRRAYIIWIIVASLCLVIAVAVTAVIFTTRGREGNESDLDDVLQVPISDVYWMDTREQNGKNVRWNLKETAIVFPWNERESYEKYTTVIWNGEEYNSRSSYGDEVYANQIGEKLGDAECIGYDMIEDKSYSIECEAFEILGVDSARIVAVKYEGYDGYYAFMNDEYNMPATLGELIDRLDLTNNIKLNSFYYDSDGDRRDEHYALNNEASDQLWEIIKGCSSAPALADDTANWSESRVSFAINSSALGVYNLSFSFNENGCLTTNIENYGYTYNLGKEAIDEIVNFAIKNRLVILLPEKQYIVGTVTEIGEDYIKVDDSVMMKNPEEGIEFTVYANRRNKLGSFIKIDYFKVGDTVRVEHSYLPKDSYTEIKDSLSINECIITDNGQVLIPG